MRGAATVVEVTPPGRGAISILRLSAPDLLVRLAPLFEVAGGSGPERRFPRSEIPLSADRPIYGRLRDGSGAVIDDGVCIPLGPDTALLTLHGNPVLVEAALALFREHGWTVPASSRGASAELGPPLFAALPDRVLVSRAPTIRAAAFLLDQEQRWRAWLVQEPKPGTREIEEVIERHRAVRAFERPPRVVLLGPPNAGKSTLLNRLVGSERVVVDPTPGTTRDRIEVEGSLADRPVLWIDGAGVRAGARALEEQGIERILSRARTADLILQLIPRDDPDPTPLAPPNRPVLRVETKGDVPAVREVSADVTIAALIGDGLRTLRGAVARSLFDGEDLPAGLAPLTEERRTRLEEIVRVRRAGAGEEERELWRELAAGASAFDSDAAIDDSTPRAGEAR